MVTWKAFTRPLPNALRPWVRRCTGYLESTTGPLVRHELPGPSVVVVVELGPPLRIHERGASSLATSFDGGFAAGLGESPTVTSHDGLQRGIQLDLAPTAARRLFGCSMAELRGKVVSLRDLLPGEHRRLAERLAELPDWNARLDALESLLLTRIVGSKARTDLAAWACERFHRSPSLDLKSLARELGYSPKHVIDRFHEDVGVTPKQYARLVRFDHLVTHLRSDGRGSWAELAQRFGWYDQAHLSSDVKRIVGVPPSRARALIVGAGAEVNSLQDGENAPA